MIIGKSKKITVKSPVRKKIAGKLLKKAVGSLKRGSIGVMPTDTIYGLVGPALSERAVFRIYRLRHRNLKKPMIVLIGSQDQLGLFGIGLTADLRRKLGRFWPGKVSIVLPCPLKKFFYLHRGGGTIAFRLPAVSWLRRVLIECGPLAAPSANPEGFPPAVTFREARNYFGEKADFYLDGGRRAGRPSAVIKIDASGEINILRK